MSEKPKRVCRVEGCEREVDARGLCNSHYRYRKEYEAGRSLKVPDVSYEPVADFPRREGHPPVEIDMGLVERSAHIGCTNEEIVALLGIPRSTFYDHLKNDTELQETIDRGRETGKATLRRMQWQGAESGNATMLIWLGKQMLDQRDKNEHSGSIDTGMRVIVELVGDPAPALEHAPQQERRFTPRLVEGVEWKG